VSITNTVSSITPIIRGLIDDKLRIDGRDSYIYTEDNIFTLTEDFPSEATITVFKNSVEIASQDFSYDSDNNQVTITFITSGESLNTDDVILIKYSYYKKYSDTEIQGYLESSLVYFPQYQYKKTFEINSDDEIVAINDYDPTTNELYFIAIIASILIDPQNIKINIPDLSLSAKRDKSDQEQIREAFRNFKNFVGSINFEV
jgi:hypothetical protein